MTIHFDFFYSLFSLLLLILVPALALVQAALVTILRDPIDSLIALLCTFASSIFIFISMKAEFLGFTFFIVYIGAIAILFLFVVILFNLTEAWVPTSFSFSKFISCGVIYALYSYISDSFVVNTSGDVKLADLLLSPDARLFTYSLYTTYWVEFVAISLILLTAMLGAVALSLSDRLRG